MSFSNDTYSYPNSNSSSFINFDEKSPPQKTKDTYRMNQVNTNVRSRSSSSSTSSNPTRGYNDENKVFIGGLSRTTDEKTFEDYFSKYGKLLDFVIIKNPNTGQSRGFGFVKYADSSIVDELMKNRPHKIDGRNLDVKRSIPRTDQMSSELKQNINKLFVGGIKDNITELDLRTYFSQYGNIIDVNIPLNKETSKSRGFGFVTFDDYDPVDKILLRQPHFLNGIKFNVKKALPKELKVDKAVTHPPSPGASNLVLPETLSKKCTNINKCLYCLKELLQTSQNQNLIQATQQVLKNFQFDNQLLRTDNLQLNKDNNNNVYGRYNLAGNAAAVTTSTTSASSAQNFNYSNQQTSSMLGPIRTNKRYSNGRHSKPYNNK